MATDVLFDKNKKLNKKYRMSLLENKPDLQESKTQYPSELCSATIENRWERETLSPEEEKKQLHFGDNLKRQRKDVKTDIEFHPNWLVYLLENPHMVSCLKYGEVAFLYKGSVQDFTGAVNIFTKIQRQKQRECAGQNVDMQLVLMREGIKKSLLHLSEQVQAIHTMRHRLSSSECVTSLSANGTTNTLIDKFRYKLYTSLKTYVKLYQLYQYTFPLNQTAQHNDAMFYNSLNTLERNLAQLSTDQVWWRLFDCATHKAERYRVNSENPFHSALT